MAGMKNLHAAEPDKPDSAFRDDAECNERDKHLKLPTCYFFSIARRRVQFHSSLQCLSSNYHKPAWCEARTAKEFESRINVCN